MELQNIRGNILFWLNLQTYERKIRNVLQTSKELPGVDEPMLCVCGVKTQRTKNAGTMQLHFVNWEIAHLFFKITNLNCCDIAVFNKKQRAALKSATIICTKRNISVKIFTFHMGHERRNCLCPAAGFKVPCDQREKRRRSALNHIRAK